MSVDDRAYLSIGEVLSLLKEEFPDVTISKIRFLESEGLVQPARTPSGYRQFAPADVERLREVLRLKRLLGLSLEEVRELSAAEAARAARQADWHGGVEDPVRRRKILEEALTYVERQRELLRRRREELDELERELVARRRRLRTRLRELSGAASGTRAER